MEQLYRCWQFANVFFNDIAVRCPLADTAFAMFTRAAAALLAVTRRASFTR